MKVSSLYAFPTTRQIFPNEDS
ncbi:hypothetical protein CGRA01v4_09008 [Colletotrichum graminicola]|nr:hypothetical protein CGRA01v4_09008 [Colletotrichum graminicola]